MERLREGDTGGAAGSLRALAVTGASPSMVLLRFHEVAGLVLGPDTEAGGQAAQVLSLVAADTDLTRYIPGLTSMLENALQSRDGTVVCYSVRTLGLLASRWGVQMDGSIVDSVANLLPHEDASVGTEAYWALVRMSGNQPKAGDELRASGGKAGVRPLPRAESGPGGIPVQLRDGDTAGVASMLKALAKVKVTGGDSHSLLAPFCAVKDLVLGRDAEVGARAAEVLSIVVDDVNLTLCAVRLVPTLEMALESENSEVVRYSLRTLGLLASRWGAHVGDDIMDSIIGLWSSHSDESVRQEADCALVRMSGNHPEVIEKLDALLEE